MNKLNFEQIIEKLKNYFSGDTEHSEIDFFRDEIEDITEIGVGDYEVVHEDDQIDGQSCHKVFHFLDHDIYIQFDGYYSSYDGLDFSGFAYTHEVIPHYFIGTEYKIK